VFLEFDPFYFLFGQQTKFLLNKNVINTSLNHELGASSTCKACRYISVSCFSRSILPSQRTGINLVLLEEPGLADGPKALVPPKKFAPCLFSLTCHTWLMCGPGWPSIIKLSFILGI
jgi:hypothetical protein